MPEGPARWPDGPVLPGRVTVITVSYNTRELTALLLWSPALTQAMSFLASRSTGLP